MITQAQIMAEYFALERACRAQLGRLIPEDVVACVKATATRLDVSEDDVRDAVRAYSAGMQG